VRERALNMDGFLLFLDPTEATDVERQSSLLRKFRDELREAKGVPLGQPVPLPVAVCVTKIDLLPKTEDLSGTGSFHGFVNRLRAIAASGKDVTLDTIRRRHELFVEDRETFFPGWAIEEQLEELFGGRFMYFPMTSVGFGELGEVDLKKRHYDPFAIVEPILWLLHMNGFNTLQ